VVTSLAILPFALYTGLAGANASAEATTDWWAPAHWLSAGIGFVGLAGVVLALAFAAGAVVGSAGTLLWHLMVRH
jgi:hypothetical protein